MRPYTKRILSFFIFLIIIQTIPLFSNDLVHSEKTIMAQLLTRSNASTFSIIEPRTHVGHYFITRNAIAKMKSDLKNSEYDASKLFEKFVRKNRRDKNHRLKSDSLNGYVVDFDGYYNQYLQDPNKGWDRLRKDHPLAGCIVNISKPVIDKKNGFFLIYLGCFCYDLMGSGAIYLYKINGTEFIEIIKKTFWFS